MLANQTHKPLRLLPAPDVPEPLPELAYVFDDQLRRPGELHELLPLSPRALRVVEASASDVGVPSGTAARLLVEAALVRADLTSVGLTTAEERLDEAAAAAQVRRALSAAEADYVRELSHRRSTARTAATLPVRLISRATEIDVASAVTGDLSQAVEWETAAVLSGRTMLEWALLTVAGAA